MKKILAVLTVLAIISTATTLSSEAVSTEKERGRISVNTSSNLEVAPDVAEITFEVKTSDVKSMQKATVENKNVYDNVYSQLKSMINKDNDDYIKTSNYNAQPVYSYVNSKKIFERYEVTNSITVRTKGIENIGKMIDEAIAKGATNVSNLNFSISKPEIYCDALLTNATKEAKNRAEVVAKALGTSLDGLANLSTSCSTNSYNAPRLYMAKNLVADLASGASEESIATNISSGVIKINANVNASFFVK